MESFFTFAGKRSIDYSLHIEKFPVIKTAARKRTTISVAGRNGDLHIDEGAFENYTQPYECYFHGTNPAPELAHAIKAWLCASGASMRLEDTYDPQYFRMATFAGPMDVANILNQYGRCTINFDCSPQSFLKSGEQKLSFAEPSALWNPTGFPANPLIIVYGSGAGTVTVGKQTVTIKEIADQIILDCDLQHAYRQLGEATPENKNRCISAPLFPVLTAGENPVQWTGDIERLEIIPRWWTL
jgi:phage-related protein